jgi:glucokinase
VGEQVVAAAEAGAPWAEAAVDEALHRLAFAMSAAYNLLDIECVVLGGGAVTEGFPVLDRLAALVEPLVYPEIRPIALRRGALGGNAAITGAALLALERRSS